MQTSFQHSKYFSADIFWPLQTVRDKLIPSVWAHKMKLQVEQLAGTKLCMRYLNVLLAWDYYFWVIAHGERSIFSGLTTTSGVFQPRIKAQNMQITTAATNTAAPVEPSP